MIALVSGASRTLSRYADTGAFGRLIVPGAGNKPEGPPTLPWAADNGAFTGFNPGAFLRMLERVAPHRESCLFVACPDVVGDAAQTDELYRTWEPVIRRYGLPVAYVAQNGCRGIPEGADALFIGGNDAFKEGPDAAALIRDARRRGLWVHVGRVNTLRRYRRFQAMGVDSVDGTSLSRWPDLYLPRYARRVNGTPTLLTEA
ncbi:MAG TPA: hypothetical protein VN213_20260 [Solirubrobacteraceae bacterium]|nr:hypothetical protein [Solirubrobacteraceae bacterium]